MRITDFIILYAENIVDVMIQGQEPLVLMKLLKEFKRTSSSFIRSNMFIVKRFIV